MSAVFLSYLIVVIGPILISTKIFKDQSYACLYGSALCISFLIPLIVFHISYFTNIENEYIRNCIFISILGIAIFRVKWSAISAILPRLYAGAVFLSPLLIYFGDIYTAWDVIASWNRWAIEIYNHSYQYESTPYPPGIPSFLAYFYLLQGNDSIWFTAKFGLIIIPLFTTLVLVSLFKKHKNPFFILLLFLIYYYLVGDKSISGEVDYPVALLSLISLTYLYSHRLYKVSTYYTLSLIISLIALSVKQAGLVSVLLAVGYGIYNFKDINFSKRDVFYILTVMLTVLMFYGYHYLNVPRGASNFDYLLSLSQNKPYTEKLVKLFKPRHDLIIYILAVYYFLRALLYRNNLLFSNFYLTTLIIGILGTSVWFYYFGYDGRNANWAKMYIYFNVSLALIHCYHDKIRAVLFSLVNKIPRLNLNVINKLLLFGIVLSLFLISNDRLICHQISKQGEIGSNIVAKKNQVPVICSR